MNESNDLNTGLTGNMHDFFSDDGGDDKNTPSMGRIAFFVLDLIVYGLAIYSGYHGIHATAKYRAASGLGNAAGIVGILIIEVTLLAIYEAFKARLIIGKGQKFIAGITFAVGTILACLGIVGDSQMQAGLSITPWLTSYMRWGLPLAPVFMALGAAGVVVTHPKLQRQIKAALKRDEFAEKKHTVQMKAEDAKLQVAQTTANVQLNALQMAANLVNQAYRSPQVQAYIAEMAMNSLPDIMRAVGVNIPYGTVIEGQTVAPLPEPPVAPQEEPAVAPQEEPPDEAEPSGWLDRLPWRKRTNEPTQPATAAPAGLTDDDLARIVAAVAALGNSTHDTARHTPDIVPLAQPSPGQGGNGPAGHRIGGDANFQ